MRRISLALLSLTFSQSSHGPAKDEGEIKWNSPLEGKNIKEFDAIFNLPWPILFENEGQRS